MPSESLLRRLQSAKYLSRAALNRRLTAAELDKMEFALMKASLTAYELRQSVVVLLLEIHLFYSGKAH